MALHSARALYLQSNEDLPYQCLLEDQVKKFYPLPSHRFVAFFLGSPTSSTILVTKSTGS
jgi:hypothetical protein